MIPSTQVPAGRVSEARRAVLRTVGSPCEEMDRARSVLLLAADLVGADGGVDPTTPSDVTEFDAALNVVADLVARRLLAAPYDADAPRLLALSQQVSQARVNLRQAQLVQRSEAIAGVHRTLEALRTATSVSDLVRLAPTHAGKLGFRRCMVSGVQHNRWVARSCFVSGDPQLAAAIVEVGRNGRVLDHHLIESEMMRRRSALLVRKAQANQRVDPGFKRVTRTTSYVAAPIMVGSYVLGFVHADTPNDGREVEDFDRMLLSTFSECIGYAVERLHYQERLRTIRHQVDTAMSTVPDMLDEMIGANEEPAPEPIAILRYRPYPLTLTRHRGGLVEPLTRREIEVLGHMAEGHSNARIARQLFISEATVKAHVKHILRKLGASNRAEAVSRYLRAS